MKRHGKWLGTLALTVICAGGLAAPAEAGCGGCGPKEAKASEPEPEHPWLTTDALKALLQAKVPVVILDARGQRAKNPVPTAKPVNHLANEQEIARLVPNKKSLVITYCGGPKCSLSPKLAHRLERFGYENVVEYKEGIRGWKASLVKTKKTTLPASCGHCPSVCSGCPPKKSCSSEVAKKKAELNTPALKALVDAKLPLVILDARSGKYDDGRRIGNAKQLSHQAGPREIAQLVPSKQSLVVTYCGGVKCPLSKMLATRLEKLGYTNVIEFPQGMKGWTQAGFSVRRTSTGSSSK